MTDRVLRDVEAWRDLAQLMPDWRPTLAGLQKLDEGPRELGVAIRTIARGWRRDDARWDVLQGVLEFYRRQHAHELAEQQREFVRRQASNPFHYGSADSAVKAVDEAALHISLKAQRASTEGDTP